MNKLTTTAAAVFALVSLQGTAQAQSPESFIEAQALCASSGLTLSLRTGKCVAKRPSRVESIISAERKRLTKNARNTFASFCDQLGYKHNPSYVRCIPADRPNNTPAPTTTNVAATPQEVVRLVEFCRSIGERYNRNTGGCASKRGQRPKKQSNAQLAAATLVASEQAGNQCRAAGAPYKWSRNQGVCIPTKVTID